MANQIELRFVETTFHIQSESALRIILFRYELHRFDFVHSRRLRSSRFYDKRVNFYAMIANRDLKNVALAIFDCVLYFAESSKLQLFSPGVTSIVSSLFALYFLGMSSTSAMSP